MDGSLARAPGGEVGVAALAGVGPPAAAFSGQPAQTQASTGGKDADRAIDQGLTRGEGQQFVWAQLGDAQGSGHQVVHEQGLLGPAGGGNGVLLGFPRQVDGLDAPADDRTGNPKAHQARTDLGLVQEAAEDLLQRRGALGRLAGLVARVTGIAAGLNEEEVSLGAADVAGKDEVSHGRFSIIDLVYKYQDPP